MYVELKQDNSGDCIEILTRFSLQLQMVRPFRLQNPGQQRSDHGVDEHD